VKVFSGNVARNPFRREFDRKLTAPDRKQMGGQWAKRKGWEAYDKIAELTGARAIIVKVPPSSLGLGLPITDRDISPVAIAPIYRGGGPTTRILNMVITDAINPQFADRVAPVVKILVSYCLKAAPRIPERRRWGKPDKMRPSQDKK
jgi:hypothetical protein